VSHATPLYPVEVVTEPLTPPEAALYGLAYTLLEQRKAELEADAQRQLSTILVAHQVPSGVEVQFERTIGGGMALRYERPKVARPSTGRDESVPSSVGAA
jgi:hypothetical protein